MLKKLLIALALTAPLATMVACDKGGGGGGASALTIPDKDLKPGGVFVAYANKCDKGCDQLVRGDLIQAVDGKPVKTAAELDAANLADGNPHKLSVYRPSTKSTMEVEIQGKPVSLPPIEAAPLVFAAGAEDMAKAPEGWARRRLFGHASPQIVLTNIDGGKISGRDLYGKKWMIVYWDWQTREQQAYTSTFLKVSQKAMGDLRKKGISVIFAHVVFPGPERRAAPNDTDVRDFMGRNQLGANEGGPLPLPGQFRFPNAMEYNEAEALGLEGSFSVREALGQAPAILILDERGVVRWHSEGTQKDPQMDETKRMEDDVYTVVSAVEFAMKNL
jgi:hypothetical protein